MNDSNLKSDIKIINADILGKRYSFYTDSGVFSKDKADYGTKFLLNTLVIHKECGKILDLGCGYGLVGVVIGSIYKDFDIDMVDVNERAVMLSKKNIELNMVNNSRVFVSDVYSNLSSKYDYIITNPPIRAGKEVVKRFLFGSYNYLKDDGELWFVMRKDHGVKSMMGILEECFNVEVIKKDKGFYVVRAFKK